MSAAPPDPLVKVAELEGRGRALVAIRAIKPGEILLTDSPILLYSGGGSGGSACSLCFRSLGSAAIRCPTCSFAQFCSTSCHSSSSSSSHTPFVCQSLSRLRSLSPPLPHEIFSQASFLVSSYSLSASSPSSFDLLLSLYGGAAGSSGEEAALLHALLSSALPFLPPAFSPDLTAALLSKDKHNAFGLMEPFKVEDLGERRVRAYGIYPKASFFNHDCLPNACRFDYVDAPGDWNTTISVRAIHDIPEGREVCLSYFPVTWSYKERQKRLLEDYGFSCECDRCRVERNWRDEDEDGEEVLDEDEEMEGLQDDNGADGEEEFPHAYFFARFVCDRENCGGTLAPPPPSAPQGAPSKLMECNVCGRLRKEEDVGGDGDGHMLDE